MNKKKIDHVPIKKTKSRLKRDLVFLSDILYELFDDVHVGAVVIGLQDVVDLIRGRANACHGNVVIREVNDGSNEFTHVSLHKIRSCVELGRQIGEIRRDHLVKISLFVSLIKSIQTIREESKGGADEYSSCIHGF